MTSPHQPDPPGSGFWYTLWTVSKFAAVLLVVVPVAVFMVAGSQPTVIPETPVSLVAATAPAVPTAGATPTSVATPARPLDVVVPGHLLYVKGRTIFDLHGYNDPRYVTAGADPAISATGAQLAYVQFTKNFSNIYLLNRATGKSTLFVDSSPTDPTDPRTGFSATSPAWSADGATLFFSWSYPGAPIPGATGSYDRIDLSVTSCALAAQCGTATARQLLQPSFQGGGDDEPMPRPGDPASLVFTSYNYQTVAGVPHSYGRLEIVDPATSTFQGFITPPTPSVLNPTWNPTGRYLAFTKRSADDQQSSIYVMSFHPASLSQQEYDHQDYDAAHLLVQGQPFAGHPVFSPDGKYLAYVATGTDDRFHLYVARVHLGTNPYLETPRQILRAGTVDADRLVWTS